jgi:hypothetical protein
MIILHGTMQKGYQILETATILPPTVDEMLTIFAK